jgi:hypothetical protein
VPTGSPREVGRRAFKLGHLRAVRAVAEALLCDADDQGLIAPSPELLDRVTTELDFWVGAGSPDLGRGYRFLARIIEWLPFFVCGAFRRASRLPLAGRLAYLARLERARFPHLPTLVAAFKVPLTMLAFELDPELRVTGFDRATVSTPRQILRLASGAPPAKVHAR